MGKTSKWIKNFLTGKKDRDKEKTTSTDQSITTSVGGIENPSTPISFPSTTTPKEKRRWSFRRPSTASAATPQKDANSSEIIPATPPPPPSLPRVSAMESAHNDQGKDVQAMGAATAAAADEAVAAARAAATVFRLTSVANYRAGVVEETAAIKIQSVFRSYLARKALSALKGLVKLQALVRGHLVRKQATATLRCMQALVSVQARARAQRIRIAQESQSCNPRKSSQDIRIRHTHNENDWGLEENIKIVEMDLGDSKGSVKGRNSSYTNQAKTEHRISTAHRPYSKLEYQQQQISPAPSAVNDMSPRTFSGHFEDYSLGSPQCYSAMSKPDPEGIPFQSYPRSEYAESLYNEYSFFPNYMANTESSRAKVRSQSAPKSRPDTFERQTSRRRPSIEGRNVPRAVRMQRSSSHVGSTAQNYHYPWSIKLDRSSVSLMDSECGSTSTVLTNNTNCCRTLAGFEDQGNMY